MSSIDTPLPNTVLQAEQAWLGSLLQNGREAWIGSGPVEAEFFADPIHATICQAILSRVEAERPVDPKDLALEAENSGALDDLGGAAYFQQLLTAAVDLKQLGQIASEVRGAWLHRRLIALGEALIAEGFAARLTGGELLELAEQRLFDLRSAVGGAE